MRNNFYYALIICFFIIGCENYKKINIIKYYPNGNVELNASATLDSVYNGKATYWRPDGCLWRTTHYKNGVETGYMKFYGGKGVLYSEGYVVEEGNSKKGAIGKWIYYIDTLPGEKISEISWHKSDLVKTKTIEYFLNGRPEYIIEYQAAFPCFTDSLSKAKVEASYKWSHDEPRQIIKKIKHFDEKGKLLSKGRYFNRYRMGVSKEVYEGQVFDITYTELLKIGKWLERDSLGNMKVTHYPMKYECCDCR